VISWFPSLCFFEMQLVPRYALVHHTHSRFGQFPIMLEGDLTVAAAVKAASALAKAQGEACTS
jgi:microcompartment protein CcmL/EutN